jgi:peptide/nickel transport system substrate-binding protein
MGYDGTHVNRVVQKLPVILAAFLFFVPLYSYAGENGDAFVDASIGDARSLVPIMASDSASSGICSMLFNGLVKYDKDLNLVGDLAESWDILDGGLGIVFHLRRNARWHDGVPFTARDVEFTYRKLIDPSVRTPYGGDFERVSSLEVIDDHTVKVTYKEAFAPALASWGMFMMPQHVLAREDLNTTKFSREPVGLGAYVFKRWKTQDKIELLANPAYFEHRPYIDRYIYRIIPDEATIFLELQVKGVDSSGLTPLQFSRQTDTPFFGKYYRKYRLPGFNYTYLGYNLGSPLFSDKRVRQALNLAVDKREIIAIVLLGYGDVATGPYVKQSWAYNPDVVPAGFDPVKARMLLEEAGWRSGRQGGLLEKQGKVFEFTVLTNQGNDERLKTCQIIQRRLAQVGIRMKIKVIEWSVLLSQYIDKRNFDAICLGWTVPREPDTFDIWHSSKTKEGEFNFVGYRNEEVDSLLVEARRVFDQDTRAKLYKKIHRILYDDQPYMFLYVPESLVILNNRFRGVEPAAAGLTYNFIDWWVPKPEQKYRISER